MEILGFFLNDIDCANTIFKKWALDDSLGMSCSGNITILEKEGENIFLSDLLAERNSPELKLTRSQFVNLIDEWQKKTCIVPPPQEVIIKYDKDQFWIETTDY